MHIPLNTLRLRRCLSSFALLAIFGASVLGLVHCRTVDDTVLGVDSRTNRRLTAERTRCEKECNEAYRQCRYEEERRHKVARTSCRLLPSPDRERCERMESRLHWDSGASCWEERKRCRQACGYGEGSGTAGRSN
jgi:hypothetical protein